MQRASSNASTSTSSARYAGNRLFKLLPCRYRSSKEKWKHLSDKERQDDEDLPSSFRLVTWNVNFNALRPHARLANALEYIQNSVFGCTEGDEPDPCCILFQEVHARAFETLLQNEWIKSHFIITPVNPLRYPFKSCFGNVTLISRSLCVCDSAMLEFTIVSKQERSALVTEIKAGVPESERPVKLRIFNVHMESLPEGASCRKQQMTLMKKYAQEATKVDGTIIAGDMNAVTSSDDLLVIQSELRDAYKGAELDASGYTWGYQGGNPGRHPPARADKILYAPSRHMVVEAPERIGVGLKTDEDWTSDHYGLITTVHIIRKARSGKGE